MKGLHDHVAMKRGAIQYSIPDDYGCITQFTIMDCYLVPTLLIHIFSPQHWYDAHPGWGVHHYFKCIHGHAHAVLEWDDTICHVPKNTANVCFMHSPPGYITSDMVLWGLSIILPDVPSCFLAHVIPPDSDDIDALSSTSTSAPSTSCVLHVTYGTNLSDLDHPTWSNHHHSCKHEDEHTQPHVHTHDTNLNTTQAPLQAPFDLEDFLPIIENGEPMGLDQVYSGNPMALLLHWHYHLGHLTSMVLQQMTKQGIINKALAK